MNALKKWNRVAAVALALVMMFGMAMPVMAAVKPEDEINGSGNGWKTDPINVNGVLYTCTVSLGCTSSESATSGCNTAESCTRLHGVVTMQYLSNGSGKITVYSKGTRLYGTQTGTSKSYAAEPSSSYGAFLSYVKITGTVTVTTINENGTTLTYTFSPTFTA